MKALSCLMVLCLLGCESSQPYLPYLAVSTINLPVLEQSTAPLNVAPNNQTGSPLDNTPDHGFLRYREAHDFQRLMQDRSIENLKVHPCYAPNFFDDRSLNRQVKPSNWLLKTSTYAFLVKVCPAKVSDIQSISFYSVLSDAQDSVLIHQGTIVAEAKAGDKIFGLKNTKVCDVGGIYYKQDIAHFAVIETTEGVKEKTESIYLSNVKNESCQRQG